MGLRTIRKHVQSGLAALVLATTVGAGAQEVTPPAPVAPSTQERIFGLGGSITTELEEYKRAPKANVQTQSSQELALPAPGNLQYFGFTGACPDVASIRETRPFMNLCTIDVEDPRWSDRKWTAEMMANDMRAIVIASGPLFQALGPGGIGPFVLRSDHAQRWQNAIAGKEPQIAAIAAYLYPIDEPTSNGVPCSDLQTVHDLMKGSFSFVKTLTSLNQLLTANYCGNGQPYPLDAVSSHRYGVDYPQNDPTFQSMEAIINAIAPDKERIYVIDAWIPHGSNTTQAQMVLRARNYYDIARENPQAKGLIGFHWPSWTEGDGASSFSRETRQIYQQIGNAITHKCLAPLAVEAKNALFFQNCRFYATLDYVANGVPGKAHAKPQSNEFGQFTFFSDTNVEMVVKIIHFPAPLNYDGVFFSGISNLDLELNIHDGVSGNVVYHYEYDGGTLIPPGEIGRIN